MFFAGRAADMPDFIWVARVVRSRSFDFGSYEHWFARWHAGIQRYEFPAGLDRIAAGNRAFLLRHFANKLSTRLRLGRRWCDLRDIRGF